MVMLANSSNNNGRCLAGKTLMAGRPDRWTRPTSAWAQGELHEVDQRLDDGTLPALLDVRLNNRSRLDCFAKRDDLRNFVRATCSIDFIEVPSLAPTGEILAAYRHNGGHWATYEPQFLQLLARRRLSSKLQQTLVEDACLLCGEHAPTHGHRRLVAEHLCDHWGTIDIQHLQ